MRKGFYDKAEAIYLNTTVFDSAKLLDALFNLIEKENKRGYNLGDRDNTGCTILQMVHPNTWEDVNRKPQDQEFDAAIAYMWNDNDGIQMAVRDMLRDQYDELERGEDEE